MAVSMNGELEVLVGPLGFDTEITNADDLNEKKRKAQNKLSLVFKELDRIPQIDDAIVKTAQIGHRETGELSKFIHDKIFDYFKGKKIKSQRIRGPLKGKCMKRFQNVLRYLELTGASNKRRDWLSWMTVLQVTSRTLDSKIKKLYKLARGIPTWTTESRKNFEEFLQSVGVEH